MSDKLATLKAKNSISFKALESGETEVSFVVDKLNYGEKTRIKTALEEAGDTLTVAVSKYRKRRSLSANAYFWELIGRLSEKLNISERSNKRRRNHADQQNRFQKFAQFLPCCPYTD